MNALRSVAVEFLGWADNAGPLPLSFAVAGILIGVSLVAVGVVLAVVSGYTILGVSAALTGVGILAGTILSVPRS